MKILATSDMHGDLPDLVDGANCDLLLIAGDICPDFHAMSRARYGDAHVKYVQDRGEQRQLNWLRNTFKPWLESLKLPRERIVGIAGNHDFVFEHDFLLRAAHLPWTYLRDSEAAVDGIRVWGTPWVPNLARWAFHASQRQLQARADLIPEGIDILMTHGPPYGYTDFVAPQFGSCHVGDETLNGVIERVRPQAVVCGHIHEGYGIAKHETGVPVYNVSRMDEAYVKTRPACRIWEFE
jgi:Icc-related predicted phosphoesterase